MTMNNDSYGYHYAVCFWECLSLLRNDSNGGGYGLTALGRRLFA